MYIYIHINVYMCVCVCVCIYIYINVRWSGLQFYIKEIVLHLFYSFFPLSIMNIIYHQSVETNIIFLQCILKNIYLFIYLAMLGLRCGTWDLRCGTGFSLVVVHGLQSAWAL